MKKMFELPDIEVIEMGVMDVITTSGVPDESGTPDPGTYGLPILRTP